MVESLAVAVACMSMNVYHESRGEPTEGQVAVAWVTLNRARRRGQGVCAEVVRDQQFSWVNGGRMYQDGKSWKVTSNVYPRDKKAWEKAKRISRQVLLNQVKDPTYGSDHYHNLEAHPFWGEKLHKTRQIGRHIFYRKHIQVAMK